MAPHYVTIQPNKSTGVLTLLDTEKRPDFDYTGVENTCSNDCRATPGETTRAGIRQDAGGVGVAPSLPAPAKNSTPSLEKTLNAERRLLEGIRLPTGHRYFPDRERETYARFIDWSIHQKGTQSLFGTYTFKNFITPYRAHQLIDKHLARMSEALNHSEGGRLRYFVATEWQQRDVIHFHSLLTANGLGNLSRKRWEARWEHMSGRQGPCGFARLYDADMGAAPYLAKYLNKRRGGELRIGGAWQGINPPGSIDPGVVIAPDVGSLHGF